MGNSYATPSLDSFDGWCGNNKKGQEWIEIDLRSVMKMDGVILQSRHRQNWWVTNFELQTSNDRQTWEWVDGKRRFNSGCDSNRSYRRHVSFQKEIKARY